MLTLVADYSLSWLYCLCLLGNMVNSTTFLCLRPTTLDMAILALCNASSLGSTIIIIENTKDNKKCKKCLQNQRKALLVITFFMPFMKKLESDQESTYMSIQSFFF